MSEDNPSNHKFHTDRVCMMGCHDWDPVIEALSTVKDIPRCGDVAKELINMFIAAQDGKYYCIEILYEDQRGRCFVKSTEFIPPAMREQAEQDSKEEDHDKSI